MIEAGEFILDGGFVSIPFPGFSWPKIFSCYPLLKSLSHSFGLLRTAGMLLRILLPKI
jgi:hypothetical protein